MKSYTKCTDIYIYMHLKANFMFLTKTYQKEFSIASCCINYLGPYNWSHCRCNTFVSYFTELKIL